MRVVEAAKDWSRVGGMFLRNPLGEVAAAIWLRPQRAYSAASNPQRVEWVRKQEKEIDRVHARRRRQGMPDSENDLLRRREIAAMYDELRGRYRQGLHPFAPKNRGKNDAGE
jgi:hypothetical protein